jgi:BirA family biotin operon repressor/biotin-[acetyl-CoA-carboxylase] ligase
MNPESLKSLLKTRHTGRDLRVFDTLDSTNAAARDAARAGAPDGAVFAAAQQSAGRGRFERAWASPRGGLWMSLLLRPGDDPAAAPLLPMAASLALRQTLLQHLALDAQIAWPNDLVWNGKKLAGLLMETSFRGAVLEFAVLGIGLNVNNESGAMPSEAQAVAVSCAEALGRPVALEPLAAALLNNFEPLYDAIKMERSETVFQEWKTALNLIGNSIEVRQGEALYRGVVEDVDAGGGLVMRLANGKKAAVPMDRGSIHTDKYSKKI